MASPVHSRRRLYTVSVTHEDRDVRNVTISLSDELARWTRVKAAECDKSMSAFIAEVLEREQEKDDAYWRAYEDWKRRPSFQLRPDASTPQPTRAETYDGPRFR